MGPYRTFVHEIDEFEGEELALTDRADVQDPRKGTKFRLQT